MFRKVSILLAIVIGFTKGAINVEQNSVSLLTNLLQKVYDIRN